MTKAELLRELESLSDDVRRKEMSEIDIAEVSAELQRLRSMLDEAPQGPLRDIRELKGLGKEIWQAIDVDEYIRELRGN